MREARYVKSESRPKALDEFVADDVAEVHLESLDTGCWWLGITHNDGTVTHITMAAKRPSTTVVDGVCQMDV